MRLYSPACPCIYLCWRLESTVSQISIHRRSPCEQPPSLTYRTTASAATNHLEQSPCECRTAAWIANFHRFHRWCEHLWCKCWRRLLNLREWGLKVVSNSQKLDDLAADYRGCWPGFRILHAHIPKSLLWLLFSRCTVWHKDKSLHNLCTAVINFEKWPLSFLVLLTK